MNGKCLIVGISGVTCGGKTTLTNYLHTHLSNCTIIHQDTYFYPDDSPHHIKVPNMDHNNYDILSSLNMPQMYDDVVDLVKKCESSHEKSIIIIEGFTILNYKPISDLCQLKYQIFLSKEECEARRNLRTYDPPDIPGYFDSCVWPEYCKYTDELKSIDNVIYLDGANFLYSFVKEQIKTLL